MDIRRVITLGTSHPDVLAAARILDNLFIDDFIYEARHIPPSDLREGSSEAFVSNFGTALEEANVGGNKVHVAVTAGRAGMGALAALATNLYGTDYLWHFWVTDEIAEGGLINRLRRPLDKKNKYLNPAAAGDPELYELVELPFVDLRPLHPIILEYAESGKLPEEDPIYGKMLTKEQLDHFLRVFPAGLTIGHLREIRKMEDAAPTLSPDELMNQVERLGEILSSAGFIPESMRLRLRQMVLGDLSVETILEQMGEASRSQTFREQIGRWLDENSTRVTTSTAIVGTAASLISATASIASLVVQIMATTPHP